jgi:hypothetical protein
LEVLKVWFDILTPKQVMFFFHVIKSLRQSGHKVLCTSRRYREAVELAKLKGLHVDIVGKHGGPQKSEKLIESAKRTLQLARIVRRFEPDVVVTFSSPEAARVAFGLGIKHLGCNDSPHAEAVARLTLPLMTRLSCPWVIPYDAWACFGIRRNQIRTYRALDPAAWLKRIQIDREKSRHPIESRANILIRVEESKASYIADKGLLKSSLVDEIVQDLSNLANLIILPRYQDQIAEITDRYKGKAHVLKDVVDGTALLSSVDIFIGAGGTMTTEASLMGLPTISISPIVYYTDRFLIRRGLVQRAETARDVGKIVRHFMSDQKKYIVHQKKAMRILNGMEDPVDIMKTEIKKLAK